MKDKIAINVINDEKELFNILDNLKINEKTEYINIPNFNKTLVKEGSERTTLKAIDNVRTNIKFRNENKQFRFGKLIKNGENKFIGIKVYRVK